VWIRVGPRRAIATREEERRLSEKRRSLDLPYDHQPVAGSGIADLDLNLFQRVYLPSALPVDVLRENERSVEQQLSGLHLLAAGSIPNVAGILTVGKDPRSWVPGAYVQFVRFDGTDLTSPIRHQEEIGGAMPDLLQQLDRLLVSQISLETIVNGAGPEARRPDYPVGALTQIVRNGVLHRTYEGTNAPLRVYWLDDRVEVHSPGGPYGQVTVETIGQPGVTDYRNPLLAEAMKTLGYVQRFGIGFPLAQKELRQNGNPALEIQAQPSAVLVTLRRRP
jgi:ATP-dependent DNA helicase RecG